MNRNVLKITVGLFTFIIGIWSITFWLFDPFSLKEIGNVPVPETIRTENAEEYAVYSVVINSVFIQDKNFTYLPFISNQTKSFQDDAFGIYKLSVKETILKMEEIYPSVNREILSDYITKNSQSVKLNPNFSLPIEYFLTKETNPINKSFIRFSRIGFNKERTQAFVDVEYLCALCGFGKHLLLVKIDGSWIVRGEFYNWVS